MGMEQGEWQEYLKAAAASGMSLTAPHTLTPVQHPQCLPALVDRHLQEV